MDIAFISPYPPSQVTLSEYGYHLISGFKGKPEVDRIFVLTNHLEDDSRYGPFVREGIQILPCWRFGSIFTVWHLLHTLFLIKPDVVILNLQFMTFGKGKIAAALGLLTPWAIKVLRIPTIVILHNITETVKLDVIGMADGPIKKKLFLWIGELFTRFLLKADVVGLTISQYVDLIKDKYRKDNVVLLPHGNFEIPQREYLPHNLSEVNLMAFGKFGTYKKVEVLLDALDHLEKWFPDRSFKVTIAGTDNPNVSGYLDSVKLKYAHRKNVEFTGYVPESQVEKVFKESSMVVFPYTTTTGSSGILHQAGSYARACILPKIDDLERVLDEEGYAGEFFEVDDPKSLAGAVALLLRHPDRREGYETQNYNAALGLPMDALAQWYLLHAQRLCSPKCNSKPHATLVPS